jgi:hypothetical protein
VCLRGVDPNPNKPIGVTNGKACSVWRVAAPPGIAFAIQEIAKREHRSISNAVIKLVGEAIDARRIFEQQPSDDVKKLLALLTAAKSAAEPASVES